MKVITQTFQGYAQTVINQADQLYIGKRNDWVNPENAQNYVTNTAAIGYYTKEKSTYKKPHTLFAYDFEADIPSEAVVTGLKFEVRMRHTDKLDVLAPIGVFDLWQNKGNVTETTKSANKTGWYKGAYRYVPTTKISGSYSTVTYSISSANLKLMDNKPHSIDAQGFGLQLRWRDATSTGQVRVEWVRMTVNYVMPQRYLTFDDASVDRDLPTEIGIDNYLKITLTSGNFSQATESDRTYVIDLPLGFEFDSAVTKGGTISFDDSTMEWGVTGKGKSKSQLELYVIPRASGLKELRVFDENGFPHRAYFFVTSDRIVGFDEIICTPHDLRRGELSCVDFNVRSQSSTTTYGFNITIPDLREEDVSSCSLLEAYTSDDVSLEDYTISNGSVNLNLKVPVNEEFYFAVNVCYFPRNAGEQVIVAQTTNNLRNEFPVEIADAYDKHIKFNTNDDGTCSELITVETTRVISQVEGDLDVIPIYTDTYDADMYVDESSFAINQWKRVKYIGCVEVPYSHYEPKHTSKDKLLDEHYKNKQYLGKENAVDEDITLSIKVPRRKVPTLIGLVNIDRPIPINLVPEAFENDPLNHRGWAEIYGIEVTPTNPLYDTCEIDVKYITHNIISRFNIFHAGKANPFSLPNVYTNSLETGEDIGGFFDITTDGSYIYDGEDISVHRNLFSLSNQQDVIMRSKDLLASKSKFELYWDTVKFSELRENNITRVVRLIDSSDKVVFEYEYYDFDFSDDIYSCRVMGRVLTDTGFNPVINKDIYIHSDVEYTTDDTDEDYDEGDLDFYGSSTVFELDSNVLTILEKGFSGYEFEQTVTLQMGSYYLEVYWKNNNNDVDTGNSINYFDFDISELTFDTALSEYYNKLLVSPYPVPNKKIVFTRESEEGTIYYLENDGGEFNFLLEPFYQYKCGTDLVAEGTSIFDFNNSYPIIYIQNCLIRFGINRLNGDLYLDKWDNGSKSYIRTNRFRIDKFDDAEVTKINDDTIIVEVSDIIITIWRGRPYIMLQHETEDIHILDNFSQAFADGIGDDALEYPIIFNLSNSQNLLPECIGGTNLLKSSCVSVWEDDTILDDVGDFVIIPNKTECYYEEDVICNLLGDFEDGTVSLIVNDAVVGTNVGNQITTTLTQGGLNTIYAVYHGNDTTNIEISNMVAVRVLVAETQIGSGGWKLECLTSATKLSYNQGTVDFKLTCDNVPMMGYMVEVYNLHQTWHLYSDADGIIRSRNLQVPAGTHNFIATVYDDGEALTPPCTKKIKIVKSTPQLAGTKLSIKAGERIQLRLVEETKYNNQSVPMTNVSLDIEIGGKKYVRTTNDSGYVYVKMAKKGTYTAKVKYAGEKNKYNSVTKTFTIVVK